MERRADPPPSSRSGHRGAARRAHRPLGPASAEAIVALVVLVGAVATAWWRLGAVARGTAWAEDGGLFLRERIAHGVDGTLLRPYGGYLHLVPRLVVDLAVHRPIEQYALTVSAASCVVVGVVAAAVFVLSRDVLPGRTMRLLLAAVPVVLPLAPVEIAGNAANLHWYALVLVPWLFAYRARSWWSAAVVAVLALAATLTELQAVVFLPLLALAWWPAPRGAPGRADGTGRSDGAAVRLRALPVTLAAIGGGAAQVVTALTTERASERGYPAPSDVVAGYLLQPVAGLWDRRVAPVGAAVAEHGPWVLVGPALAVLALLVVALVVAPWRARVLLVALAGGSVVVWTAALLANAPADGRWSTLDAVGLAAVGPSRYAAAAGMLLLSAVVLSAALLVDSGAGRVRRTRTGGAAPVLRSALGWCVVALVVATSVTNAAPGASTRSDGPEWAPQVRDAEPSCRADPLRVLEVRTAPWSAQVPCALVLRDR
ncbi:hypothetical protein QUG98_10350 [Curtobacterium sp. RHCJP20]|uniref:DUF2029 domain-containing protein n=1 Tax=Curtobacterium subtropicum TaxID=3055138 RepID=A0ABT7TJ08_9MICO|nr:hypothetical protein [Curtobacterium subtropicum]MDM7888854.1 hypothetical protein [Curtobacterium subtropicum]